MDQQDKKHPMHGNYVTFNVNNSSKNPKNYHFATFRPKVGPNCAPTWILNLHFVLQDVH